MARAAKDFLGLTKDCRRRANPVEGGEGSDSKMEETGSNSQADHLRGKSSYNKHKSGQQPGSCSKADSPRPKALMGTQHWHSQDAHRCQIGDVMAQVEPDQVTLKKTQKHRHRADPHPLYPDKYTKLQSGRPGTDARAPEP